MKAPIRVVIYFYIFICVVLLAFNLLYMFRSGRVKRRQGRKRQYWERYLGSSGRGELSGRERKALVRRLRNVRELTALYEAAGNRGREEAGAFFRANRGAFIELAAEYGRKTAVEQAFFAYVAAAFYPPAGERRDPMLERLLGFLEGSTVYSRENVLNALYALGNPRAVEHAFLLMSQRGWYHDPRLLADGLARFQGDREALAERLWGRREALMECFQAAVARLAAALPGDGFAEPFLAALETEALPTETRFALVRYFHRHAVPQAEPVLLALLRGEAQGDRELAAAAASLESYPDGEARRALEGALRSAGWHVRKNAARALKGQGAAWEEVWAASGGDRYAEEMLEYVFGRRSAGPGGRKEGAAAV